VAGADPGRAAQKNQPAANIRQIALEMAKAFRALALYPIGHPQLKTIFHASYQKIFFDMSKVNEVAFTVGKDGMSNQGRALETALEALTEFSTEMHIRQVRKFGLRSNLNERDLVDFLRMLLIPAEQFRAGKKIEEYFRAKQISTLWVNEVDFAKVFTGGKAAEAQDQELDEASKDFLQARVLVESLDLAGDDGQALSILGKISAEQARLAGEQKLPELWYVTGAASDFCELKRGRFPQACSKALELLKTAARPQFLAWLIERYNFSDVNSGKAFERYFDQAGEPAVEAAVLRLLAPESVFFQKQIISFLRGRGEKARPFIEARLKDPKTPQARKLIYMTGEFKNPESASILIEFAAGEDKVLKLEAIRALGKIKSRNATQALVGMLHRKNADNESRLVLVQLFGEQQESLAVPGLIELLKSRRQPPELREKAAEALGKIKSREALSVLTEVLSKPGFLRKPAPEKVRLKAAEALHKIGGERAEFILSELARGEDRLAQYCRQLTAAKSGKRG